MVFRIFVEKKPGLDNEARALKNDIAELLQIGGVENVRLFNRYDVDDIEKELFDYSVNTVFSEPQLDNVTTEIGFMKKHDICKRSFLTLLISHP